MDYVIANPNRKIYIRLGKNGRPETCTKQMAQRFEKHKASSILKNIPRTMKKFNFSLYVASEDIPCIEKKVEEIKEEAKKEIIVSEKYTVSDSVTRWVDRVKSCNDLAKDAAKRKEELINVLSNVDKDLSNSLHEIELTNWKNGCEGYKEYKSVKIILEKRRAVKDELTVVQSILDSKLESIATNRIEKIVNGLSNRTFSVREVCDYDVL